MAGEGKHRDPLGSSYKLPRPLLTFCLQHSQLFFFFFHVNASFTWTLPYTQDGHVQWGRHPVLILIVLVICLVSFASPLIGTVSHCKYELMAPHFKVLWEVDILTWLNMSARIWKYSQVVKEQLSDGSRSRFQRQCSQKAAKTYDSSQRRLHNCNYDLINTSRYWQSWFVSSVFNVSVKVLPKLKPARRITLVVFYWVNHIGLLVI